MGASSSAQSCCLEECFKGTVEFFSETCCDCHERMSGVWNVGLFECIKDIPICLIGCFVPFGYCYLSGKATGKATGEDCCFWYLFAFYCLCVGGGFNRKTIRKKFELKGYGAKDCSTHFFCGLCAVCQEYNFVELSIKEGRLPEGDFI